MRTIDPEPTLTKVCFGEGNFRASITALQTFLSFGYALPLTSNFFMNSPSVVMVLSKRFSQMLSDSAS